MVALHNGTWVVAGLTSFGQACESAAPGSYANVYNLLPFVNDGKMSSHAVHGISILHIA